MAPDIENRIAALDPNLDGYGFSLTVAVLWWANPTEHPAVVFTAQVPGEQRRRYRPMISALVYQALME